MPRRRLPGFLTGPTLIPSVFIVGVVATVFVLVFQITLRPWGGTDTGIDTHLNYIAVAEDYSRSEISTLGFSSHSPDGWVLANIPDQDADDAGLRYYVASGCASCHGMVGEGGLVGPPLVESSPSEIRRESRGGPGGMPEYGNPGLLDEQLALISDYLISRRDEAEALIAAARLSAPVPTPVATPWPSPSPVPVATAILTPTRTAAPDAPEQPDLGAPPGATPGPAQGAGGGPEPTPEPTPTDNTIRFTAASASITVDGDISDWEGITGAPVLLQQIIPIPGKDMGDVSGITINLRLATDADNVYVLLEIPDDYDYVEGDSALSSKPAVMFRIDPPAEPHMGATEENQKKSFGLVDIWHWELDCGPGVQSGGRAVDPSGVTGGNDRACNLDDEYAATPKDLEDDGSPQAENSLLGVWEHTGRTGGNGSDGTWIFEFSRPLQTGDPQDAQLASGATVGMAIAYWDADETPDGWTDLGHLQSSTGGWIEVTLP